MEKYFNDVRDYVKGLVFDCPFFNPLSNCSSKEIRKLPLAERIEVVNSMSLGQLAKIISQHKKCSQMREQ